MNNCFILLEGDAVVQLQTLGTGSVQLTVTSPPYDNLRTYGGHSWDFEEIAKELYRVTCEGGIVCWNVGDSVVNGSETLTSFRQAIYFKNTVGFRVHDTMIWQKPNFANPASNRYHQLFEYVFVLSKGKPRCFNPIKDKLNKYLNGPVGKNTVRQTNGDMEEKYHQRAPLSEFGMRGNVWKGNTSGQEDMCGDFDHPATMPNWLAHDLILSWSNVGDIVLDPMAGSGTTGKEAIQLGRKAILIEINPEYIPIIESECTTTMGLNLA